MEVLPLGSFGVFTNVNERQQYLFDAELNQQVSEALVSWIKNELKLRFPNDEIVILEYETIKGCIITSILIGVVISAKAAATVGTGVTIVGAGGAVYKVITDYDKIKKNLKEITEDVKKLWIRVFHKKKRKEKQNENEAEREIEVYKDIPDDLKKYYTSGKDIVIISEKETLTCHKICIMRDDIKEEISKETVEKEVRTIDTRKKKKES